MPAMKRTAILLAAALAIPVLAPRPVDASTTVILRNVPQYWQLPMSCEETAASMALVHQGKYVSTKAILSALGTDWTPITIRNGHIVRWGNPDKAFVGNVYGHWDATPTGFFAYPKALVRAIKHYGGVVVAWSEPGVSPTKITASMIYAYVAAGHPVVAYGTWDWRWHPVYYYTSEDGNRVPNFYPAGGHARVVYGVSTYSVLVRDPYFGTYWVSKTKFATTYNEMSLAVVLK